MSQYSTLLGVIVGAAVVGATLAAKDIMDDPEKAAAVKEKLNSGYRKVCEKVGEGCAAVRGKVAEGYGIAKEKAAEGYATAKEKVAEGYAAAKEKVASSEPVRRIKKKVDDIRRAAEPASPYFREEEEETDVPAEEEVAEPAAE